jgi:hypothetical protein
MYIHSTGSTRYPQLPAPRPAGSGAYRRVEPISGGSEAGATAPRAAGILPQNRSLIVAPLAVSRADALHASSAYRAAAEGAHPFPAGTMLRLAV